MCLLLSLKLFVGVAVFNTCMINWRGGPSALNICALCHMLKIFSVVVFHTSLVSWSRGSLLYLKLIWCRGIP